MKKIIFLLSLFPSYFLFGQLQTPVSASEFLLYQAVKSKNGKEISYADIKGSPYPIQEFRTAKIAENYEVTPVRYNAYSDEVEFEKESKVYVLPKENSFSRVEFTNSKDKLVWLKGEGDASGYFFELAGGKNALLKKVKIAFVDATYARTSYDSDKPAKFQAKTPVYYIKTENGIIENPSGKNDIMESFPNKKDALNTFFKSEKIKFNKEEDLIKLVNFLNAN